MTKTENEPEPLEDIEPENQPENEPIDDPTIEGEPDNLDLSGFGEDLGFEGTGAVDESQGLGQTIKDMLLSTEPNPDLSEVETLWDTENGGSSRVTRGIQKMFNYDGIPAILDITIGFLEMQANGDIDLPAKSKSTGGSIDGEPADQIYMEG